MGLSTALFHAFLSILPAPLSSSRGGTIRGGISDQLRDLSDSDRLTLSITISQPSISNHISELCGELT